MLKKVSQIPTLLQLDEDLGVLTEVGSFKKSAVIEKRLHRTAKSSNLWPTEVNPEVIAKFRRVRVD